MAFYETSQGDSQAVDWLKQLDPGVQAGFGRIFDLLEEYGTEVREPYVSHVRDKIWEVRDEHDGVQYRLLYFPAPRRRFVMLHGFVKKTQKLPPREFEVAQRRLADYMHRREQLQRRQQGKGKDR